MFDFLKKKKEETTPVVTEVKVGPKLDFASAEAYNMFRTNIAFSISGKEGKGKVIAITSSTPAEGKSYTAINLSYSLAKDGQKVVLIDGDMRKPSIEKTLKIKNKKGLSSILVGKGGEECLQKSVLHDNIDVLVSGVVPPNPSELLGNDAMKDLLSKLSEKYDYIVLDLPPVNVVTDAVTVANFVDGYILIVRHGITRRKEMLEAIRKIKYVNGRILGVVYNGYYRGSHSYYKKSYYKSKYYYTSNKKTTENTENKKSK